MHQPSMYSLSEGHPLNEDPMRPWPWKVLVGYRARGNRKVTATRSLFIRAAGCLQAEAGAMRQARHMPMVKDGEKLLCSRIVSSRPLDKYDAIDSR